MRPIRLLAAVAAGSLLAAGPLAGFASAADPAGVGTGTVSATAVRVDLGANGDLLSIRVLGDDGSSTIDPIKGARRSSETLRPLTISSKRIPALDLSVPAVATTSTGAEDKRAVEPAVPNQAAFSGKLNAIASSVVDGAGARAALSAGLANLKLAGGLVHVPTGLVQVSSRAAGAEASGSRSITIPDIRVLDLSAVLDGLGLKLTDLSVTQLLTLLRSLGVTLPGIADPAAAVAALNTAIDTVKAQTGALTAELCATVDGLLAALGGVTGLVGGAVNSLPQVPTGGATSTLPAIGTVPGGNVVLPIVNNVLPGLGLKAAALPTNFSCSNLTGTVQDLLTTVQSALGKVLAGGLAQLGDTALLSVKDVKVSLVATATDAVDTSVADVTASIGQVKVGNLAVPGVSGLDLAAPVATLNQAAAAIQSAVGSVLAAVNANLASLVKVDVLKIEKVVGSAGAYTHAASTVTALTATLTPPATLGAALIDLTAVPTSTVLGTLATTVPTIAPVMGQLEATLGGLQALSGPSSVTIGQLTGDATFRPVAASVPGQAVTGVPTGELPRTGGDAALPAMAAVVLGGAALAIRRLLRIATI
ncbi:MAG: hypothetical protein JWN29_1662 [Acidimicrobiales bacterium]|nr:hypothetical protein [Acidimicrobiales bacterium]